MSVESPGNAKDIFLAAIEIPSAPERDSFLKKACGPDESLRNRVDGLIRAHERPEDLLDGAAPVPGGEAMEATIDVVNTGAPGARVGPYTLRERLGTGGMGVVWAAEQKRPLRRKVALKLIKPGMDTEQVLARFQAEREALTLMDHPNIARVLDAGTTDRGHPYFVMELIRGIPITDYCDLKRRNRSRIFPRHCGSASVMPKEI